jgi:hypothetical protein
MSEDKSSALIGIGPSGALMPQNFDGMWRLAQVMAASGMMPKNLERPEAVFVAVQFGLEIGLTPMQAVQSVAVINGRPSLWGDGMLGLVRGSGLLLGISETIEGEGDHTQAVCTVTRKGDMGETTARFGVADAKRAGLWDKPGPWKQYPRRMLQLRARAFALRDKFPDVLKGLYAREELPEQAYKGTAYQVSSTDTLAKLKAAKTKPGTSKSEPEPLVLEPMDPEHGPGLADVLEWIDVAKDREELDLSMDAARDVDLDEDERQQVADAYDNREATLAAQEAL